MAQENKYLGIFKEIIMYVHASSSYLQHILNIPLFHRRSKLSPFAHWPGAMINPPWIELHTCMSKTISMVPKMFETLKFDCT